MPKVTTSLTCGLATIALAVAVFDFDVSGFDTDKYLAKS